ncbi:hypothetical protein EDB89DRAFT_2128854 [Lactarius sanguifluus]|nr:hypothetical protein EDB89DRAFT_2128854 [Lactarius sanguifluus]
MTHPPEDNVVLRWVIVEFTSDMAIPSSRAMMACKAALFPEGCTRVCSSIFKNVHVWRKCRVGRAGDKDKGESLWQVGQLETRTREEKTREAGTATRNGRASAVRGEDGGRAMVIHTPTYSTIIQLKRVAAHESFSILYGAIRHFDEIIMGMISVGQRWDRSQMSRRLLPSDAAVNVDPRHDVLRCFVHDAASRDYVVMTRQQPGLGSNAVVDNGTRAGRVSSREPKSPAQSVPLVMPEAAAAATHARTQDPEEQSKKYHEYSISPHEHRCQYHEPKKSKTHAVTSCWYTDAGTRSRDEVSHHIPNSEAALLALRNNDWTGSPPATLRVSVHWQREVEAEIPAITGASAQPTAGNVTTGLPLQFLFLFSEPVDHRYHVCPKSKPERSTESEVDGVTSSFLLGCNPPGGIRYRYPRGSGDGGGGDRGRNETRTEEQRPAATQTEKQTNET